MVIEFPHEQHDVATDLQGWLQKGNKWIKIINAQRVSNVDLDSENYDDLVRHLITESGEDSGWVINSDNHWNNEPLHHVKPALQAMGLKQNEINSLIGSSVLKPWTLVSRPFQSEYPGDRIWNRKAPQLRFAPTIGDVLNYPTWQKVLHHIGKSLDQALMENPWAVKNGIKTGADYLKIWIASMIQHPKEPLPYLFIYGETQETGKSTLHEALSLLFFPGYENAGHALQNKNSFNAELEGAILCIIEEIDLHRDQTAYNRIKDWVTSPKLSIHRKGQTPYMIDNTTHFIQTANQRNACPIFPGDTRIVMIHVGDKPTEQVPKRFLLRQLEKEAPDFLGAIMSLEIPESESRLRVPVIETTDKA
ncbi:MAG: primase-helicase family protein, partial [Nitrososphaera sp.]